MPLYTYALLAPSNSADAEARNQPLLGASTLGIEVTEPALAERCGLGNLDPQHDGSGSRLAAIEAAADWPVPPPGATLVTIRPDLDAFGAMAVLTHRAEGRMLTPPMKTRIAAAGEADRFDRGRWPGRRPWPASPGDLLDDAPGGDLATMAAAMRDGRASVETRVAWARAWVTSGAVPETHRRAALERAARLWAAIRDGELVADETEAPGRMVEIVSEADGALALGYRVAPVVVALNPRFAFPDGAVGPKYTIAQYAAGHADLDAAVAAIGALELGWGGSPTIKGSPQGRPSRLKRIDVARAVARGLKETAR